MTQPAPLPERDDAEALEQRIRLREREVEAVRAELEQRDKELEQLHYYFTQLYDSTETILASRRWKIGNAIGNFMALAKMRTRQTQPVQHIRALKKRLENTAAVRWMKERQAELENRRFVHHPMDDAAFAFAEARLTGRDKVTIIIPVYNAVEETRACIESVLEHTTIPYKLLIINDASPDPKVKPMLESFAGCARYIENPKNLGFVGTVNRGMKETKGDVVLLNSDTKVTARWLQKLIIAASSRPNIATVTPFSNAAGAFSVPTAGAQNDVPEKLGLAGMARLVEQLSDRLYPEVPTGNGFCMYIRREALDDVGLFDQEAFGRGYGEENDFCMRARAKGWTHIIDDATYIFHTRSASFGADKEALIKENRAKLDAKHPEYTSLVKEFVANAELAAIRSRIVHAIETGEQPKPVMLYVMHQGGGGTPYTNMDLMSHVMKTHRCYLLTSDARYLILWDVQKGRKMEKLFRWPLPMRWQVEDFTSPEHRILYLSILSRINAEAVHIRHLLGHSFDVPEIAKMMGLPVVMSFHDFYFTCPSIHLLDSKGNYCGANCNKQSAQCNYSASWLGDNAPNLSGFNAEWRRKAADMFRYVDEFVTTTNAARDVHVTAFGSAIPAEKFHVFEHGRDFPPSLISPESPAWKLPEPGKKIDILFPGQMGFNKGIDLIREIKKLDKENRLHFHFLGKGSEMLSGLGTLHGEYEREEFPARLRAIRPSFVGIFSIWPETYCHTLSEGWACGVPVLASDIGAIAERVRKHDGGFLIDYKDAKKAYAQILAAAADTDAYQRIVGNVAKIQLRTTKSMAEDYLKLYAKLETRA